MCKYTMCVCIYVVSFHEAERNMYECMSLILERGVGLGWVLEGRILRGILLRYRMYDKERQFSSSSSSSHIHIHTNKQTRTHARTHAMRFNFSHKCYF